MLFREVIDLISITRTQNNVGSWAESETLKQVFADKKSIRQSEFYQAQATGLKPELMFIMRSIDYTNETRLKYNNKLYEIIRTHEKNGELIELVCQGIVGTEVR